MTAYKPAKAPAPLPPDVTPEQAAERRRREQLMETAALAEAMSMVQKATKVPSGRTLSRIARHLRDRPDLRRHPVMEPFLNAILDRFIAEHPIAEPGATAKALMVEWWNSGKNAVPLPEARRRVADLLGELATAVKQAHLAYRKRRR